MNRYLALDALRGFTIASMILVNSPGSWNFLYSPLGHAEWHGFTFADIVFPLCMFIIGAAMYFSNRKIQFILSKQSFLKVLKRTLILFVIGVALNAFPFFESFGTLRIMGVLQRIAIAYFIASILVLTLEKKTIWVVTLGLTISYELLLYAHSGINAHTADNNLVRTIDLLILGSDHMYQGKGFAFDPEGIFSSVVSTASILIGYEVCRYLTSFENKVDALKHILWLGIAFLVCGWLAGHIIPINKSLWTASYVIFSSGVALMILGFFIWLIDVKKYNALAKPWLIYGVNPLFVYILSWLVVDGYLVIIVSENTNFLVWFYEQFKILLSPINASLAVAVYHVVLFWLISYLLYKRNIIIKI